MSQVCNASFKDTDFTGKQLHKGCGEGVIKCGFGGNRLICFLGTHEPNSYAVWHLRARIISKATVSHAIISAPIQKSKPGDLLGLRSDCLHKAEVTSHGQVGNSRFLCRSYFSLQLCLKTSCMAWNCLQCSLSRKLDDLNID